MYNNKEQFLKHNRTNLTRFLKQWRIIGKQKLFKISIKKINILDFKIIKNNFVLKKMH